jgi:hypothetical protein
MLLVRAALPSRFNELRRPEVAAYLEVGAREETGHDRLALKGSRALAVPGELSTGALVKTSRRRFGLIPIASPLRSKLERLLMLRLSASDPKRGKGDIIPNA